MSDPRCPRKYRGGACPRPNPGSLLLLALAANLAVLLARCGTEGGEDNRPLREVRFAFGSTGTSLGQFVYPRAIALDRRRNYVYVVDKTGRVQQFGLTGEASLEWRSPEIDFGKPTGLAVAPDGRVFVADTHYSRIIVYDNAGTELSRIGEYGQGRGQFIGPAGVAFGPGGRLYVSEYGGNDRVQILTPDGHYISEFGSLGSRVGQFNQPRKLAFNADLSELFIADARNHRIVVTDPNGRVLRTFGRPGRRAGELAYPYDLVVQEDGSLIVCEFGNHRIQRFSPSGECLDVMGQVGAGPGELEYPWGVGGADGKLFILDSGNNRVQVVAPLWKGAGLRLPVREPGEVSR